MSETRRHGSLHATFHALVPVPHPHLKEVPADAEIVPHQLLPVPDSSGNSPGGLYTFLPWPPRSSGRWERSSGEEMDRAGAIEVLMPSLQPTEIWQASGRYEAMRDALYKVRDRAQKEWALGPTHEEVITTVAAGEISSYSSFPELLPNRREVPGRDPSALWPDARQGVHHEGRLFLRRNGRGGHGELPENVRCHGRILPAAACAPSVEADTGVIGGNHPMNSWCRPKPVKMTSWYCESRLRRQHRKGHQPGPLTPTPTADTGPAPEKVRHPGVVTIEALTALPVRRRGARPDQDAGVCRGPRSRSLCCCGR